MGSEMCIRDSTNINHHHTIPHQQPYLLRPRPLTTVLSHNSIAPPSDHDSSSSSFSSQNCSTISDQPNHQSSSNTSQSYSSQQLPSTLSFPSPSFTTHSQSLSERLSLSDLSDYPFVTRGGIQQLLYLDEKNNNNLTKQSSPHPHFLPLHPLIQVIMHPIPIPWNQHFLSQLQKYKLSNPLHDPISQPLYSILYIINKVYGPEIGYSNITLFIQD